MWLVVLLWWGFTISRLFPAGCSQLFRSVWGTGMRNQKIQGREQNVKTFPDMECGCICWPGMAEGDNSAELPFSIGCLTAFPPHHPLLVPNPKNVTFIWRICCSCHSLSLMKVWENSALWAVSQAWCELLTQPPSGTQHITEILFFGLFSLLLPE